VLEVKKIGRFIFGLGILLVVASLAPGHPAQVIIIRHAEKPPVGSDLTLRGEERAAALVPYFLRTEELLKFNTPVAIYAQKPSSATSSRRAIETVKPLADALRLKVNNSYYRDDYKKMVNEIMQSPEYEGRTVLICWEHRVIPAIASEFSAEGAPTNWPDSEFDRTWVLTFGPSTTPQFRNLPQQLMYGDSDR
jgi:hypothetical protein